MCGIAGLVAPTPSMKTEVLRSMGQVLRHRGPDDFKLEALAGDRVALVHRRLKIIDLSDRASQPMSTADRSLRIVYNGEIYNFRQERELLRRRGVDFVSQSDTEVLLRLYEIYGTRCLDRLNGMFAFAIDDRKRKCLFLARDRAGVKPLVHARVGNCFFFASEIKALLQDSSLPREIDPAALMEYFAFGYIPAPRTIFKAIRKLEPAHYLVVDYSGNELKTSQRRYWNLPVEENYLSQRAAREQLRELLEDATEKRLVADVPVGAFLSGGIDSTIVAGLMSRAQPLAVKTFTLGYEDAPYYDERRYARLAADRFGSQHTEIVLRIDDLRRAIGEMLPYLDEPFGDSSVIPAFVTSRALREHVTVALSGDGGDELFGGYNKYKAELVYERAAPLLPLLRRLTKVFPSREAAGVKNTLRLIRKFAERADDDAFRRNYNLASISRITDLRELFPDSHMAEFLDSALHRLRQVYEPTRNFRDRLNRVLYADYSFTLPYDMLAKMDFASMRASLENRSPFLDYRIAELCSRIESRHKTSFLQSKKILRSTFSDVLPDPIRRRSKKGFEMPVSRWLRNELRDEVADRLRQLPDYFSQKKIEEIARKQATDSSCTPLLWSLYVFSFWLQSYAAPARANPAQAVT